MRPGVAARGRGQTEQAVEEVMAAGVDGQVEAQQQTVDGQEGQRRRQPAADVREPGPPPEYRELRALPLLRLFRPDSAA